MENLLLVQGLNAGYGTKTVLYDISFAVRPGQFISIIAPNGTGKSTLLKTVAGILPPLQGNIVLKGNPLTSYKRREIAKLTAVVGSDAETFDYTAQQMVFMGRFAHIHRFSQPSPEDHRIVRVAMENVGMWHKRRCLLRHLSQGEKQKVIIARALAQEPELLLLDEPVAHLDVCNQIAVLQLIRNLAEQRRLAVLAAIHDINLALAFSTHLLFLKDGHILAYGEAYKVLTAELLQALYGISFHRCTATLRVLI